MIQYKIEAAKFDYEFLGKSKAEIAKQYDFPIANLKAEMVQQSWTRKIEPTILPDVSDIETFAAALQEVTEQRLNIICLYRQINNQPLYAQIEKAMLTKILELTNLVSTDQEKASSTLLNLVKAVQAIQTRDPAQLAAKAGDAKPGLTVQIANIIQ